MFMVQNGSDPKIRSNNPKIMKAQIAVKLTFGTNVAERYPLQSSVDLAVRSDEGSWFDGTGTKLTQLVDASKSRFY